MKSYGILKQFVVASDVDKHIEELSILGYSILDNVLTQEELSEARVRLDAVYRLQEDALGRQLLSSINDADLARCPLAYDDFFLHKLAANPKVVQIAKAALGDFIQLHLQNGIINLPTEQHHQTSWHRDLPYQDWIISTPIALGCLYCIDDFNEQTGGTYVLPYTHKRDHMPSKEYMDAHAVQVIAPAGSAIMFDAMLFHRAGVNKSNRVRRGINNVFTIPLIKQQIDLPRLLQGKFSDDPFLHKLLGYAAQVPESDSAYRIQRANR